MRLGEPRGFRISEGLQKRCKGVPEEDFSNAPEVFKGFQDDAGVLQGFPGISGVPGRCRGI